ncbi:unnamed protein product [Protopolystoma xenopodis]|uniref:Uncharacterized protein n=1 Tax=Protopolystoma xenopodis TaxID=117903 RepID=A0A448WB92_9PLAT|nr:unnamed protein product [Protopolystoma xenopodis]
MVVSPVAADLPGKNPIQSNDPNLKQAENPCLVTGEEEDSSNEDDRECVYEEDDTEDEEEEVDRVQGKKDTEKVEQNDNFETILFCAQLAMIFTPNSPCRRFCAQPPFVEWDDKSLEIEVETLIMDVYRKSTHADFILSFFSNHSYKTKGCVTTLQYDPHESNEAAICTATRVKKPSRLRDSYPRPYSGEQFLVSSSTHIPPSASSSSVASSSPKSSPPSSTQPFKPISVPIQTVNHRSDVDLPAKRLQVGLAPLLIPVTIESDLTGNIEETISLDLVAGQLNKLDEDELERFLNED